MTFEYDGQSHRLTFGYTEVQVEGYSKPHRVTLVEFQVWIPEGEGKWGWATTLVASASCAPEDVFRKETGRQIALGRLVDKICIVEQDWSEWVEGLPDPPLVYHGHRELRGKILHTYFSRHQRKAS